MAMKAYKSYKNVDLPWLKRVPEHWEVKRIGSLFSQRIEKVSDKVYAPLTVTKYGIVPQLSDAAKTNNGDDRKLVCVGDFVINSRSDRKGSSGLSKLEGSVAKINLVLKPRTALTGKYIHYLLKSNSFIEEYYRNGRGIVADLWTTGFSDMKTIWLPVPPKKEQDQIVRYLDWQNSRLNKLINAKKKEIALLEELLASIISNCTSKVQLWHTKPFTKIAKICSNVVSSDCYKQSPQISPANIEKNTGCLISYGTVEESGIIGVNNLFFKGQILYSKIRPMLNKVTLAPVDGLCSTDIYPIETSLHAPYLIYFMLSGNFLSQIKTSDNRVKMPRLNKEELSSILVDFPDYDQQIKIARYLDIVRAKIKNSISSINNQIITLQEYRTRLVADVVTGQIDVRNIAIPNYETVTETIDQPETTEDEANTTEE